MFTVSISHHYLFFQRGANIFMKILFYGTKNYDEEFFEKLLPSYPGITIKFTEANIHEETASLAKGYEAILKATWATNKARVESSPPLSPIMTLF